MWFQSHAGSIEAASHNIFITPLFPFQSHAGSIEAYINPARVDYVEFVSIPRWFD